MIRAFLAASTTLFITAIPAAAQEQPAPDRDRLIVNFGAGAQIVPTYPGADSYTILPLFGGQARREGDPLNANAPDDGFGISIIGRRRAIEIGPMIQFQAKRREEDVGAAVGDVGFTVEPGAFINIKFGESFRVRAEVRHGIGGHDAWVGDVGADLIARPSDNSVFTIGPRLRLADSDYMNTYFGVTPGVSATTGLTTYAADGGIRAAGVIAGLTQQLSRRWGIYAYAGYDRLVSDAADSPVVRAYGSRDQFSGGISLYYSFRMRNPF